MKKCKTHVVASPALRWIEEMQSARIGGPRDAIFLYKKLIVNTDLPDGDMVLIDDVYTTGGHLKASAWVLQDKGRKILAAICCGRTTWQQLADPFAVENEMIDTERAAETKQKS